ncbi:MAG: AAA family ATPase [Oscillospiraceae bacterium]|nr:AAA family ATPase [Oscillospiraceae bacterium]
MLNYKGTITLETQRLILISGMPGTGKSTYAQYLSENLCLPLVSYDHIKSKEWDYLEQNDLNGVLKPSFGKLAYDFFWFFCDEIMATKSSLIADYIFHPMNVNDLNALTKKHGYKAITVLFDCDVKVAYDRFTVRNKDRHPGIAVRDISYEDFEKDTKANRDFRYGDKIIHVKTNDFESVSYEDITREIITMSKGVQL